MRPNVTLAVAAAVFVSSFYAGVAAQAPAQAPPAQTPPAGRGAGAGAPGRGGGQGFPKTQRPPADPAVIERGTTLYGINCRLCHGADLRGGDMGGINLLRSQLVLSDQDGELILPVVHGGLDARVVERLSVVEPVCEVVPGTDVIAGEHMQPSKAAQEGVLS